MCLEQLIILSDDHGFAGGPRWTRKGDIVATVTVYPCTPEVHHAVGVAALAGWREGIRAEERQWVLGGPAVLSKGQATCV
jgi:hypothetical protein